MQTHELRWECANAKGRTWEEAGLRLCEADAGIVWEQISGKREGFIGYGPDDEACSGNDYGLDLPEEQQGALDRACDRLDLTQWYGPKQGEGQ